MSTYSRPRATNYNVLMYDASQDSIGGQDVFVEQADKNGAVLGCFGASLPADGTAGFAKGCLFRLSTASAGYSGTYTNVGTDTSCQFIQSVTPRSFTATVGFENADYICDGVADNVQIQAAIDAVKAAGGGNIAFQAGTYNLAATIVMPFDPRIRLMGAKFVKGSTGGTMLKCSATMTNMFTMIGNTNPSVNADLTHDFMVEQMTFNGNGLCTNIFYLSNHDYFSMDYCRVISATNSIKTVWDSVSAPTSATVPGAIFISNSVISANSGIGIDLQYQTQCWISNCWFDGVAADTWINFQSCNKIKVTNCEYNAATQALFFKDTASVSCHDISVTGGTCVGTKFWNDTRTNAASDRIYIDGTVLDGDTSPTLAGTGNTVILSKGIVTSESITARNGVISVADTNNVVGLSVTQADVTNNKRAIDVANSGTGNGLRVTQTGATGSTASSSGAILVENTNNTGIGLNAYTNSSTATGALVSFKADHASYAANVVDIVNDGTGNGLYIQQNGDLASTKRGFRLDVVGQLTDSNRQGQLIYSNTAHTGGYLAYVWNDNASSTVTNVMRLRDDGNSVSGVLYIENSGTSQSLRVDHSGNSASQITGVRIDVANAGGGQATAMIVPAGNVGIGTTAPSSKAILDCTSTTQGFLPPRMTTTQRDAIASPPAGLVVYNTTTNKLNVYTTAWEQVTSV